MASKISVVIADDHSLFRGGVVQALALDSGIEVVGEAATCDEAVQLAKSLRPNLVLLDVSMPGGGISAVQDILALPEPPRVVMLTVSEQDDDIIQALQGGAVGYIAKGISALDLSKAIRLVAAGQTFVSPNLTVGLLSNMKSRMVVNDVQLTAVEEQTLRLLARGMSNREIGDQLGVSERAIKYRMTKIMGKLNVRNRVEAALFARRQWGIAD